MSCRNVAESHQQWPLLLHGPPKHRLRCRRKGVTRNNSVLIFQGQTSQAVSFQALKWSEGLRGRLPATPNLPQPQVATDTAKASQWRRVRRTPRCWGSVAGTQGAVYLSSWLHFGLKYGRIKLLGMCTLARYVLTTPIPRPGSHQPRVRRQPRVTSLQ